MPMEGEGASGDKRPREEAEWEPEAVFHKMQRLDPSIKQEDYRLGGSCWDEEGMREDFRLMNEVFHPKALESALLPIRQDMQRVAAQYKTLHTLHEGAMVVVPGVLALGDAAFARNIEGLKKLGVKRVVNCSPQTVRTGVAYYQSQIPGIQYMELWSDDLVDYCVLQDLERAYAFATAGGLCFVHCEQGVNRSCALVVAMRMRLLPDRGLAPEQLLRASWRFVAKQKSRALTNEGFQRQLLLFARLGLRWFPSVSGLWRTPPEHDMARFRVLAERVGQELVGSWEELPLAGRKRAAVFIRDGVMRQEQKLADTGLFPDWPAFDLSSKAAVERAERRVRRYGGNLKERILAKEGISQASTQQPRAGAGG